MNKFFDNPFIPDKKVNTVIIDGRTSKNIINNLEKMNIEVVLTEKNGDLYDAISYHPDILLHPLNKNRIIVNPKMDEKVLKQIQDIGFEIMYGNSILNSNYPQDIAYNVARVGMYAFHNFRYTDSILKNELESMGVKLVNVRQGYSKCSVAIVNENAIITSDNGIASAAQENGIDVLLICPGDIILTGMNYGFIGGTCGLISKDTLAFTGSFINTQTHQEILKFLSNHKVTPIFLSDDIICDIGSIIPIQ